MRTRIVVTIAALVSFTVGGTALASTVDGKKPPVKLSGKVNAHGTGKAKDGAVDVEADDFYFEKTYIRGDKGETLSVTISNEGNVQHTFTIDKQDVDETLDTGDSVTVEVKVPKNGKPVAAYCRFHKTTGMQMAFFSKSGKSAKSGSGKPNDDSGAGSSYDY